MKILYFHQHFSTPGGGTGTRSYEFSKALTAKGHEVIVVCGSFDVGNTGLNGNFIDARREGVVDGIRIVELEMPYSNQQSFFKRASQFIKFAFKCIKEINKQNPDIVFCTSTPLTIAIPGLYAKWIKRKRFIFEVRDLWPELPVAMGIIKNPLIISLLKFIEVAAYKSAAKVVALSSGMADGVTKYIPQNRVETISNGCDLYLASQASSTFTLPQQIQSGDIIAIYSGTHGIANGLDSVIDAAKVLSDRNVAEIKFLLVGDGMLKPHLKERTQSLGLDNVVFLDNMPKHQLFELYQRCHIGLMVLENIPAFYNGTSPNKFFDYLAAGLSVACNYPGWIAEEIRSCQIGEAVAPGNPELYAEAILRLATQESQRIRCGANATKLAEEKYNRDKLTERFVSVIESTGRDGE